MGYHFFSMKKVMNSLILLTSCVLSIGFLIGNYSCNGSDKEAKVSKDSTGKKDDTTGAQGLRDFTPAKFFQLKIDSATLVSTFFLTAPADRFKKLFLSFTVKDYNEFPDSLTLNAQAARPNDDLYSNCASVLLDIKDTTTVDIPKDVLFNTLELSYKKLKGLVGKDGQSRRYKELIFIPFAKDSCGRKYLNYRVQCWPPLGGASEPVDFTNPCPPHKPNEN